MWQPSTRTPLPKWYVCASIACSPVAVVFRWKCASVLEAISQRAKCLFACRFCISPCCLIRRRSSNLCSLGEKMETDPIGLGWPNCGSRATCGSCRSKCSPQLYKKHALSVVKSERKRLRVNDSLRFGSLMPLKLAGQNFCLLIFRSMYCCNTLFLIM